MQFFCFYFIYESLFVLMSDLYVSWSEYHKNIEILTAKIYQSGWEFNQIVCIAKGGLRIGNLICRIYDIPLAILFASSYGGAEKRVRGKIRFSQHLASVNEVLGDRILLVDDLADSGTSLLEGVNWLKNLYGDQIKEIRTGVIWWKAASKVTPDYYVAHLKDNPWIHQPFEYYEKITPEDLSKQVMAD